MSGLFTRLAQQQIGQRRHTIAVAQQPLFRQDLQQGSDVMMDEPEGVTAAAQTEDVLAPRLVTPKSVNRITVESKPVIENSPQTIKPTGKSSTTNFSDHKPDFQTEFSEDLSETELQSTIDSSMASLKEPMATAPAKAIEPARKVGRGFQEGSRQHHREITERERDNHAEQETVINVSIGRIEVKAIAQEKKTPKTKTKSKRQPLMSLDDYQAQRVRGER